MKKGDILGHENMGEVVEVGPENKKLKDGDRVVVPFTIACGECSFCRNEMWLPSADLITAFRIKVKFSRCYTGPLAHD